MLACDACSHAFVLMAADAAAAAHLYGVCLFPALQYKGATMPMSAALLPGQDRLTASMRVSHLSSVV